MVGSQYSFNDKSYWLCLDTTYPGPFFAISAIGFKKTDPLDREV